jgi:hypothetical protein
MIEELTGEVTDGIKNTGGMVTATGKAHYSENIPQALCTPQIPLKLGFRDKRYATATIFIIITI